MNPLKSVARALLVVALMVGVLTIGSPPAQAESSGPICEQGVLNADGQCETEVDPIGVVCPATEADGECFDLVPAIQDCASGTLLGDGSCRVSVPDTVELSCLPPSEPTDDGGCVTSVPAVESLECELGNLVDGTCLVLIGPAEQSPSTCPEFEDDNGCFTTVSAVPGCVEGFLDGDVCVIEEEPVEGELECPVATFTDIVDFPDGPHCGTTTVGTVDCGLAEPIGNGECRDAFVSIGCEIYFELIEFYDFIQEDQGGCYGIIFDVSPPCLDPFIPIFEGDVCGELLGAANACPDGYVFDGEQCVRVFAVEPTCPAGHPLFLGFDAGGDPICFQDFGLLVPTLFCSDGNPFEEMCLLEVPAEFSCASGSLINENECRISQDPTPGALFCPEGLLLVAGECFEDAGPPETVFSCPEGEPAGNACLVLSNPTETTTCGQALGEPGDCHILEPSQTDCPPGATAGAEFPESCRQAVDRVGGGCPDGATDLDGRCVEFSDPVWFCNNELVTINMTLGDSGNGTNNRDVILGTPGNDIIRGFAGDDVICGGAGNDRISGNAGNDEIFGEAGVDRLIGGSDDDFIDGGTGNDLMFGGSGDDQLWGSFGNDLLNGSRGDDILRGGAGDDDLNGQSGTDILRGGFGADDLNGGPGTDSCFGGAGPDDLTRCESGF